jgi:hypothetical protein
MEKGIILFDPFFDSLLNGNFFIFPIMLGMIEGYSRDGIERVVDEFRKVLVVPIPDGERCKIGMAGTPYTGHSFYEIM